MAAIPELRGGSGDRCRLALAGLLGGRGHLRQFGLTEIVENLVRFLDEVSIPLRVVLAEDFAAMEHVVLFGEL